MDPKKNQELNLAFHNLGADLLVAAKRAALNAVDRQTGFSGEQCAGGAGGERVFPG